MKPGLTSNRTITATIAMALLVGTVGLGSTEAHATAAFPIGGPEEPPLRVEVATEILQADAHRDLVEARSREVLERRPRALAPGDRIIVEIAGTIGDYEVSLQVLRHGQPLAEQPESLVCKGSLGELGAVVETAVDEAIDRLIEAREAEERAAHEAEEKEKEKEKEKDEPKRDAATATHAAKGARHRELATKPYRPARLGLAGAIATALGGAVVLTGAIVTGRGSVESGNDLIELTEYRPPGYVLLGVGSTVVATGIALLVVDVVRCKKDRVKCGEREPLLRRTAQGSRGAALRW